VNDLAQKIKSFSEKFGLKIIGSGFLFDAAKFDIILPDAPSLPMIDFESSNFETLVNAMKIFKQWSIVKSVLVNDQKIIDVSREYKVSTATVSNYVNFFVIKGSVPLYDSKPNEQILPSDQNISHCLKKIWDRDEQLGSTWTEFFDSLTNEMPELANKSNSWLMRYFKDHFQVKSMGFKKKGAGCDMKTHNDKVFGILNLSLDLILQNKPIYFYDTSTVQGCN
jgi:hypothetical protein